MKITFLNLGKQPIANNFLPKESLEKKEYFFDLEVVFNTKNNLVSLKKFVEPEKMFNDQYVYHSSQSSTMRNHFRNISNLLKNEFKPNKVVEIGSNDGVFSFNFDQEKTFCVEPCGNFAKITSNKNYKTYNNFWNYKISNKIKTNHGLIDLVYSANCMCHIQDLNDAFSSIYNLLSEEGIFVFEDPSLLKMISRNSFDQIYDEHAHIFSVLSIKKLLEQNNLDLFRVESLNTHGGSNRIFACKKDTRKIEESVTLFLKEEIDAGLDKIEIFQNFAKRVEKNKKDLVEILRKFKLQNKKIVSYGATSKSTTVFNYCEINDNLIEYITDTTIAKQGKFSPGVHIPVYSDKMFDKTVDVAFLGAWNFKKEIFEKEKDFLARGGVFITHIPEVKVINQEEIRNYVDIKTNRSKI